MTIEHFTSDDHGPFVPLDDGPGPALPVSEAALDAAAKAAVSGAFSAKPIKRRKPGKTVFLVAAIVVLPSLAAALVVAYAEPNETEDASTQSVSSSAPAHTQLPTARGANPNEEAPTEALPVDADNDTAPIARKEATATNKTIGAQAASKSAEDMLKKANGMRREGRWSDAASMYSRVAQSYPGTAQASVASLAAASLYLEHLGNPSHALQLYQRASRSSSLAAEADLGIAKCYRALGDKQSEIQALEKLITAYPNALFRQRSEHRLRELQGAQP